MLPISENIRYILNDANWFACKNQAYCVKIQKGDPARVYNVPEKAGVVFNILERTEEPVKEGNYVVTGVAGESWPISVKALRKYDIAPEDITFEPQSCMTKPVDTVYCAIQIPAATAFWLCVDYGEIVTLNGNSEPESVPHGTGDYVLVEAKQDAEGKWFPDFESNSQRIINGAIFETLYRKME